MEEKKTHKCSKCEATFASRGGLWIHNQAKHKSRFFKCEHCGEKLSQKVTLIAHVKRRHPLQPRKDHHCFKCNRSFASASTKRAHEKSGCKDTFLCDYCNKHFSRQDSMRRHQRTFHKNQVKKCISFHEFLVCSILVSLICIFFIRL